MSVVSIYAVILIINKNKTAFNQALDQNKTPIIHSECFL